MDIEEKILKLRGALNEVLNNQITKYLSFARQNKNIPPESIIFLEYASSAINNSIVLVNNNDYVDSMSLLRCAFEAILHSLAIHFDDSTYTAYKCYDKDTYSKVLETKYANEKRKNPKFVPPKINKKIFNPGNIREIVSMHYNEVYKELFSDCSNYAEVNKRLTEFYRYLCKFTHPSILKTWIFKIQNDESNLESVRSIFKLNINFCILLLTLTLNFFSLNDDMDDIYSLYGFLSIIEVPADVQKLKEVFKKYNEYLYMDITRNYMANNKQKLQEIKDEIDEISRMNNSSDNILGKKLERVIVNLDAIDIVNKYMSNDTKK